MSTSACACRCAFIWLLPCACGTAWPRRQFAGPKVARIEIKHIGPPAVSDELIRANIRVKAGDPYLRAAVDDDVRNLYATGFFYNIQVGRRSRRRAWSSPTWSRASRA